MTQMLFSPLCERVRRRTPPRSRQRRIFCTRVLDMCVVAQLLFDTLFKICIYPRRVGATRAVEICTRRERVSERGFRSVSQVCGKFSPLDSKGVFAKWGRGKCLPPDWLSNFLTSEIRSFSFRLTRRR
jgi:hypothetical protein